MWLMCNKCGVARRASDDYLLVVPGNNLKKLQAVGSINQLHCYTVCSSHFCCCCAQGKSGDRCLHVLVFCVHSKSTSCVFNSRQKSLFPVDLFNICNE